MKMLVILAAALALGTAWAQDANKEQPKQEEAKPLAQEKAKPVKKATSRRHMDARHCLEKGSNTEIIKCAEAYL